MDPNYDQELDDLEARLNAATRLAPDPAVAEKQALAIIIDIIPIVIIQMRKMMEWQAARQAREEWFIRSGGKLLWAITMLLLAMFASRIYELWDQKPMISLPDLSPGQKVTVSAGKPAVPGLPVPLTVKTTGAAP